MGNTCSHLPIILYSRRGSKSKGTSRMESLPDELLMNMLSRVPTLDLLQLSFVCRRWRNILKDPLFHQLHLSHSMSNPNENQVVLLKTELKLHLVDLDKIVSTNPRQIALDLPLVHGIESYSFIGSCNGLLCLGSTKCRRIIVINPINPQHVLFSIHLNVRAISWGFGFDERSKLFKVIVMTGDCSQIKLKVKVCDLGSDGTTNWRSIGDTPFHASRMRVPNENWTIDFKESMIPACFVNGRLHWTYYDAFSIISFDLADEKVKQIPGPDDLVYAAPDDLFHATKSYPIKIGGCLGILHFRFFQTQNLQIWVMKGYGVEASWVKEIHIRPVIPRTLDVNIFQTISEALGLVKDNELVLLNRRGEEPAIVFSSDSTCTRLKHLKLKGISTSWHDSIVHTASLCWV